MGFIIQDGVKNCHFEKIFFLRFSQTKILFVSKKDLDVFNYQQLHKSERKV